MALLLNRIKNIVHIKNLFQSRVNYGSALFVIGDKGIDVCPPVSPFIDFEEKLADIDSLKDNIKRRSIDMDVDQVKDVWDFLSTLRQNYGDLDQQRQRIHDEVRQLNSLDDDASKKTIEKLKMHLKVISLDMKNLKTGLWSVEEKAMIHALAFPNTLHSRTPLFEPSETSSFKDKPRPLKVESHLEIATKADLLKFTSPQSYYLKKDAAVFELCGKFYFSENLRAAGFTQFSNPDFTKSAIVEGCGLDHTDSDKVFILHHNETTKLSEDNRLHLTGGGSLLAFAAYHAKHVVFPTAFPLKYFALGRQYVPVPETSKLGLFQVSQSSVVQLFIAVKDSIEDMDTELDNAITLITDIYKNIGFHFKVCCLPAAQLKSWESLHVSFQMFSPFLNTYIEVGNISVSDDYVSKRLHFNYKEKKVKKFPKIISGTILSIPKFLGCVLEQNPEEPFQIPPVMKKTL